MIAAATSVYLVAFAQVVSLEIVTFDKRFTQYQRLRHTIVS
jgi:predicted nucleic acid-binding protein